MPMAGDKGSEGKRAHLQRKRNVLDGEIMRTSLRKQRGCEVMEKMGAGKRRKKMRKMRTVIVCGLGRLGWLW